MIDLIRNNLDKIHELCGRFHVTRLEVFGSAVDGRFNSETSDVDFIVEFEPMDWEEHADAYLGLLAALDELLPVPTDLNTEPPADRRNPYFWAEVAKSRQVIYESEHQKVPV